MKPCPDRERELIEIAASERPVETSASSRAHLAACAGCAAALDELRARQRRIDTALKRLVHAAEPRGDSVDAVLRRASDHGRPRRYWPWGLAAAAAALVLAMIALYSDGNVDAESISTWQSPTAGLLRSPAEALLRSAPALGESYGDLNKTLGEQEDGVVQ